MGLQQTSIVNNHKDEYPHFYLCNYLPGSVGRDSFSNSLLKFKRGEHPDLEAWTDCTLEQSARLPVGPHTIILRALHHHEFTTNPLRPASLDRLGNALSKRLNCRYHPDLLQKSRPVPEIKKLTRPQRETALFQAYRFSMPSEPCHQYLILDDIVTTGSTLNAIIAAIHQEYSHPQHTHPASLPTGSEPFSLPSILAFSLARAEYDPSFNLFHSLQGKNYRLEQGSSHWRLGEEPDIYSSPYSSPSLKEWIRKDFFPGPS